MKKGRKILLSFDIEEFDVPLEHGVELPFGEQMRYSAEGTVRILDTLKDNGVRATFFCTSRFAENAPAIMSRIIREGHEVASHGCNHSSFETSDLLTSRLRLEELTQKPVYGYRMARMQPVDEREIRIAGYRYNSSINPCFIPGRYTNLHQPRTHFVREGVFQIPASVTPWVRFPLFWLSYHNLPARLYRALAGITSRHDGYLSVYFHPWEFVALAGHPELKLPRIITRNSGEGMVRRLDALIRYFRRRSCEFVTYWEFTRSEQPDS